MTNGDPRLEAIARSPWRRRASEGAFLVGAVAPAAMFVTLWRETDPSWLSLVLAIPLVLMVGLVLGLSMRFQVERWLGIARARAELWRRAGWVGFEGLTARLTRRLACGDARCQAVALEIRYRPHGPQVSATLWIPPFGVARRTIVARAPGGDDGDPAASISHHRGALTREETADLRRLLRGVRRRALDPAHSVVKDGARVRLALLSGPPSGVVEVEGNTVGYFADVRIQRLTALVLGERDDGWYQ